MVLGPIPAPSVAGVTTTYSETCPDGDPTLVATLPGLSGRYLVTWTADIAEPAEINLKVRLAGDVELATPFSVMTEIYEATGIPIEAPEGGFTVGWYWLYDVAGDVELTLTAVGADTDVTGWLMATPVVS